jgi:2-keto-4-pentenoate hydratase
LDVAERTACGIRPLTERSIGLTAADAWRIAEARDRLRAKRGELHTGYKLGWTSDAMRRSLGIETPNFGSLWAYMAVPDGELELARLIHPKAEPEFAFLADHTLGDGTVNAQEVIRSGRWAVALEVVDPRWESYKFDWLDNTADGSSAAAYVVGEFRSAPVPPEQFRLTMETDEVSRQGVGEAAMGSPSAAVAWLVERLRESATVLQPGMVVLTGGITAPVDLVGGMTVAVSSPQLGGCTLHCRGA